MKAAVTVVPAFLLAVALTACGISSESTAHRVEPDEVPFDLLDPAPTTAAPAGGPSVPVYLVRDDRLVERERTLPRGRGTDDVIALLAAGPTPEEADAGLSSSLPEDQVAGASTSRGLVQVDLRATFAELRARDQALAIAQLVFTLTARPGIGRVGFTLDGAGIEVPRGDGALTTDPLSRDDFPGLVVPG